MIFELVFNYLNYDVVEILFNFWINPLNIKSREEGTLGEKIICHTEDFECNCRSQEDCNKSLLMSAIAEFNDCITDCDYDYEEIKCESPIKDCEYCENTECLGFKYKAVKSEETSCPFDYTGCFTYQNIEELCNEFNYKLEFEIIPANEYEDVVKEINIYNENNKLIIKTRVGLDEDGMNEAELMERPLSSSGIENVLLLDGRLLHCSEHGVECKCQINKVIDKIVKCKCKCTQITECIEFNSLFDKIQDAGYEVTKEGLINYVREQFEGVGSVTNSNYYYDSLLEFEAAVQLNEENKIQYLEELESQRY